MTLFRKSVAFFIMLALFWVLLWRVVPDATPGSFSFTDLLRWLPLLFSFMSFVFAMTMWVIRYWGLDVVRRMLPQTRVLMWLGQHAYQYSQPSTTLHLHYLGPETNLSLTIQCPQSTHHQQLRLGAVKAVNLGHVDSNPEALWSGPDGTTCQQTLLIKEPLKKWGRNLQFDVHIHGTDVTVKLRQ